MAYTVPAEMSRRIAAVDSLCERDVPAKRQARNTSFKNTQATPLKADPGDLDLAGSLSQYRLTAIGNRHHQKQIARRLN